MTAQSKNTIKGYFQTGDKPNQAQFTDFIDSYQDAANNLGVLTSAGLGVVGLQLLACNTSASAQSIIGGGGGGTTTVSAGGVTFNNSNRILANVSAGVGTELSTTDLAFTATTLNLATTTVSAGTYTNPTVVFDSKGRATSATNGAAATSEVVLLGTGTASNSATLDFTSLITSSYDYYFFVLKDVKPASSSILGIRLSSNNGSTWDTTAGDYQNQINLHTVNSTTVTVTNGTSLTNMALLSTASVNAIPNGIIYLINPLSANAVTLTWNLSDINGNGIQGYGSWSNMTANAVRFLQPTVNITSGTIAMYGVKNT